MKNPVKSKLYGLLFKCPLVQDNPENCQLYEIRKLPYKERLEFLESLTIEECKKIAERHADCLREMETENFPKRGQPL